MANYINNPTYAAPVDILSQSILGPLQQLAEHRTSQLLQRQQQRENANQISPALQNILNLNPEQAQNYGMLPNELLKPLMTGQKNLTASGDIGVAIEGLSQNARTQLNKMEPGFKQQAYRSYLENPNQFIEIANQAYPDQAQQQAVQKPAPLAKPVEKALKATSEAADQARLMEIAEPRTKKELAKEERIKQHYEQKAAKEAQKAEKPIAKSTPKELKASISKPENAVTEASTQTESPEVAAREIEEPAKPVSKSEELKNKKLAKETDLSEDDVAFIKQQMELPTSVDEYVKEGRSKKEGEALFTEDIKRKHAEEGQSDQELEKVRTLGADADDMVNSLKGMNKLQKNQKLAPQWLWKLTKTIEDKINPIHASATGGAIGSLVGGLPGSFAGSALGYLITPLGAMMDSALKNIYPDTEQFEKLSNSFIKGAKALFGSRITDADLNAFLATVPTLMNTEHGKKQIIEQMEVFYEAARIRRKGIDQILKVTKGKTPPKLGLIIDRITKPKLDGLAENWLNNIENRYNLPVKKEKLLLGQATGKAMEKSVRNLF